MGDRTRRPAAPSRTGAPSRGATVVEFAIVLPLLVSLLFGIVEFASAYSQKVDIRHGAQEAGRLVAVNYDPLNQAPAAQTATIVGAACARMDDGTTAEIDLALELTGEDDVGDIAIVRVRRDYQAMTPFVEISTTLETDIDVRLERPATWSPSAGWTSCSP